VCAVYVDTEGSGRSQHVPTSASVVSSNYCNPHSSPIYSKLLDDSMSSYDDSPHCVINGALQGPHPGSLQTPASAPAGALAGVCSEPGCGPCRAPLMTQCGESS